MGFSREGLLRRSYDIIVVLLLLSILQLPVSARRATTPHAGFSSPASVARAAEFNVGCNVTELINAINAANGNGEADTIDLTLGCTYTLTTTNNNTDGPNGLPSVTSQITISGNGATIERSSASGTPEFRIFHVANGGSLTLNDLTISNGNAGNNSGGGIYSAGTLIIDDSAISNNTSGQGGGVYSNGTTEIAEATISNNTANYGGGGIRKDGGTLSISKSTISGNLSAYGGGVYLSFGFGETTDIANSTISGNAAAAAWGGGIYTHAPLNIDNCTIVDNTIWGPFHGSWCGIGICNEINVNVKNSIIANNWYVSCTGTLTSHGYNLESGTDCGFSQDNDLQNTDPKLGPLEDNGGPTWTHALLEGSPGD